MALGNLAQRFLVAVVAAPILILALHYDRHEPTWAIMFAASLLAMNEFFAMTLPKEDRIPALLMGAVACAAMYWLNPIVVAGYVGSRRAGRTSSTAQNGAVALFLAVIVPGCTTCSTSATSRRRRRGSARRSPASSTRAS